MEKNNFGRYSSQASFIVCDCGYNNKKMWVELSGVCNCCGSVLDELAHFKYEMNKKLRLWRGKLKCKN